MKMIEQTETGDFVFIVGKNGQPMTKESFGNWFRDAFRAAGIQKSAYGLRKFSATLAAEAGYSAPDSFRAAGSALSHLSAQQKLAYETSRNFPAWPLRNRPAAWPHRRRNAALPAKPEKRMARGTSCGHRWYPRRQRRVPRHSGYYRP